MKFCFYHRVISLSIQIPRCPSIKVHLSFNSQPIGIPLDAHKFDDGELFPQIYLNANSCSWRVLEECSCVCLGRRLKRAKESQERESALLRNCINKAGNEYEHLGYELGYWDHLLKTFVTRTNPNKI